MATIAIYANKINQMSGLIKDVKNGVNNFKSELSALRIKTLAVNKSVCDLDDVISSVQASTQIQEQKADSLENLSRECEEFISNVARIDSDVAELVVQRKEEFYDKYYYLKPECEKNGWEKFKDGCTKVVDWCKEHWKLLATIVIVVAAVVVVVFFPAAAPVLLFAAKGAIIGALSGGLIGGLSSWAEGGSFWEGFENGAFSGALSGALFGALGGAGQMFAGSCRVMSMFGGFSKVFKVVSLTAKISGGITAVMGGFDTLALVVKLFDPSNPLVAINKTLHSSKLYNAFQFSVGAVAAFSGGAYHRMRQGLPTCFVAGTMVLTVSGLVAIENIKVGDKVISTNPKTMETAEKAVLETYIHEADELVHLTIDGQEIVTTMDHPFYVVEQGFINAGELCLGAAVINSRGDICSVENISLELVEQPVKVYNFQVEDFHTYHVGSLGVLVHNSDCNVDAMRAGKPGSKEWKEAKKYIKEGKGKGINVSVSTEELARRLINEARPELSEYPRFEMGGKPGFEFHTPEPGYNYDLPHIKWQDWTGGKPNGANGHIFITGE